MKRTNKARRGLPKSSSPRLVGYVRVSTHEQADGGLSLAAQRERLRAYAVAHGFDLVGLEEDAGLSGSLSPTKRPGLSRALAAVAAGKADGVAVVKLDRLSRTVAHTLALVAQAEREGWRLASVSEALDTGTAVGRMVVTILAALAQMEREQVGERTTAAMDQIAREGRARSRFLPFGFRLAGSDTTEAVAGDRSPLVADQAEQAILAQMLALQAEGKGAHRIAGTLNAAGTVNPRTGSAWSVGTAAAILRTAERRALALA